MPPILPRSYTGGAAPSTLVAAMSATSPGGGASFEVSTTTGWPTGDYVVAVIDRGTALEETVLIQSIDATTCVLASGGRGYDGTDAKAHDAGAPIEHTFDATAAQKLVDHVNDKVDTDVHPQLLRSAEHTLPLHDELGLVTKASHDQTLHTAAPLSLLSQAAHDMALHQNLGLMADSEFTKAAVDALHVDAKTWDGWSHASLHAAVMPTSVRTGMDPGPSGTLIATNYRTQSTLDLPSGKTGVRYLLMYGGTIKFYLSGAGGGVPSVDVMAALTGPGADALSLSGITVYDAPTQRIAPGYANLSFATQTAVVSNLQIPAELRIRAKLSPGDADAQVITKAPSSVTLWAVLMPVIPDFVDLTLP